MHMRREGRVEEALEYAQGDLARLRGVLSYASRTYDAMLQDVVALLAYERPQARTALCVPAALVAQRANAARASQHRLLRLLSASCPTSPLCRVLLGFPGIMSVLCRSRSWRAC